MDTICTDRLSLKIYAFFPLILFMGSLWIWEKTLNISLYKTKWVVFITEFSQSKPSCHSMYRQLIIQHFYDLSIQCIYGFCLYLRTNSDYFLVYIKELSTSKSQWSLNVRPDYHSTFLGSAHSVYLWFMFLSEEKRQLFPYTTLIKFSHNRDFTI